MTNVLLEIFLQVQHKCGISNSSFSLSLTPHMVSFIERPHEDTSSLELFGFAHFVHELLDFLDELQCSEYWENIPLEFHRFTINCVQSSVL